MTMKAFLLVGVAIGLGACSTHMPSKVSENRIQIEQENFIEEIAVRDADAAYIRGLGTHYSRHGMGPVHLSVTYDTKYGSASKAARDAARIADMLREEGVHDIQSNVLPIAKMGAESRVVVTYTAYNALAPKDCSLMSGIESGQVEAEGDYKLGCSVDTLFAKQIVRPKDLAGATDQSGRTDGRRNANIVDRYRTGEPNSALNGESASE